MSYSSSLIASCNLSNTGGKYGVFLGDRACFCFSVWGLACCNDRRDMIGRGTCTEHQQPVRHFQEGLLRRRRKDAGNISRARGNGFCPCEYAKYFLVLDTPCLCGASFIWPRSISYYIKYILLRTKTVIYNSRDVGRDDRYDKQWKCRGEPC